MRFTVGQIREILDCPRRDDDPVQGVFKRIWIKKSGTYLDFVQQLYVDIDRSIHEMQATRQLRQLDPEDRLTADLLFSLREKGYTATHDNQRGGHIDLDVSLPDTGFAWMGEAKKDGNFRQGFLQLTTRYVTPSGNLAHNHGGLILYLVRGANAAGRLRAWSAALKRKHAAKRFATCEKNPLAVYSEHTLRGPGTPYIIRSMCVSLHHEPLDTSGLNTAARKRARRRPKATSMRRAGAR